MRTYIYCILQVLDGEGDHHWNAILMLNVDELAKVLDIYILH